MHSMHKFYTDDVEQLAYHRSVGYFQDIPNVHTDLIEVVIRLKGGRESERERIMSMNLGVTIEDMPVAMRIYEKARKVGIGEWLKL